MRPRGGGALYPGQGWRSCPPRTAVKVNLEVEKHTEDAGGTHGLRRRLEGQEASPGRGKRERVARALCLIGYGSRALESAHLGCAVTRLGCLRRAYAPCGRRTCGIVIRIAAVPRQICKGVGQISRQRQEGSAIRSILCILLRVVSVS